MSALHLLHTVDTIILILLLGSLRLARLELCFLLRPPNCRIPAWMHDATVGVIPESFICPGDCRLQVRIGQGPVSCLSVLE